MLFISEVWKCILVSESKASSTFATLPNPKTPRNSNISQCPRPKHSMWNYTKTHLKETWTMQTASLSSSSDLYSGWVSIGCICLPLSQSLFLPPPVSLSFILSLLNLPFSMLHITSLWQRARYQPFDTGWSLHANFLLVMSLPDSLHCILWHEAGVDSDETAMFSLFVQSLAHFTRSEVNHHQICNPSSDEAHALRWWIWSRKCSSRKNKLFIYAGRCPGGNIERQQPSHQLIHHIPK